MDKNNSISRDECMYLEGSEETIECLGSTLNELLEEMEEFFNTVV